jgi:hypothetical protein
MSARKIFRSLICRNFVGIVIGKNTWELRFLVVLLNSLESNARLEKFTPAQELRRSFPIGNKTA